MLCSLGLGDLCLGTSLAVSFQRVVLYSPGHSAPVCCIVMTSSTSLSDSLNTIQQQQYTHYWILHHAAPFSTASLTQQRSEHTATTRNTLGLTHGMTVRACVSACELQDDIFFPLNRNRKKWQSYESVPNKFQYLGRVEGKPAVSLAPFVHRKHLTFLKSSKAELQQSECK